MPQKLKQFAIRGVLYSRTWIHSTSN